MRFVEAAAPMTPEDLYRAFADVLFDICGGHSAVRKEPITAFEWEQIHQRFELLMLMNREEKWTPNKQ
jgi:hypothetical protein